jgi:hypothetical protein
VLRRLISEISSELPELPFRPSGELSENVNFSENRSSITTSYHSPEPSALCPGTQSPQKFKNKRLQNKPNSFAAPATLQWLSAALANGLAEPRNSRETRVALRVNLACRKQKAEFPRGAHDPFAISQPVTFRVSLAAYSRATPGMMLIIE